MKIELNGYTTAFDVSVLQCFQEVLQVAPDDDRRVRVTGTITVEHIDDGAVSSLPAAMDVGSA